MSLVVILRQCCPHRMSWEVFWSPLSMRSTFCLHLEPLHTRFIVLLYEYLSLVFEYIPQLDPSTEVLFLICLCSPRTLLLFKSWGHAACQMQTWPILPSAFDNIFLWLCGFWVTQMNVRSRPARVGEGARGNHCFFLLPPSFFDPSALSGWDCRPLPLDLPPHHLFFSPTSLWLAPFFLWMEIWSTRLWSCSEIH